MKYIKATLAMKMEKAKLTPAEIEEVRTGWSELQAEISRDSPPGVSCELKIEEVDE